MAKSITFIKLKFRLGLVYFSNFFPLWVSQKRLTSTCFWAIKLELSKFWANYSYKTQPWKKPLVEIWFKAWRMSTSCYSEKGSSKGRRRKKFSWHLLLDFLPHFQKQSKVSIKHERFGPGVRHPGVRSWSLDQPLVPGVFFLFSFTPSAFHPLRGISRDWKFVSPNILA